jgi:hypothetical protein
MAEEWSMSREEAEALMEEAREAGSAASEHTPTPETWGMYVYGDASPAIGGGVGVFLWFTNRAQMLDYVKRLLTFMSPGPASVDWGRVATNVRSIVRAVEEGHISLETGQIRLNKALKQFSQIQWWGNFDALLSGPDPFARELRTNFRDSDDTDDEEAAAPIAEDEREEYMTFLQEYGI